MVDSRKGSFVSDEDGSFIVVNQDGIPHHSKLVEDPSFGADVVSEGDSEDISRPGTAAAKSKVPANPDVHKNSTETVESANTAASTNSVIRVNSMYFDCMKIGARLFNSADKLPPSVNPRSEDKPPPSSSKPVSEDLKLPEISKDRRGAVTRQR